MPALKDLIVPVALAGLAYEGYRFYEKNKQSSTGITISKVSYDSTRPAKCQHISAMVTVANKTGAPVSLWVGGYTLLDAQKFGDLPYPHVPLAVKTGTNALSFAQQHTALLVGHWFIGGIKGFATKLKAGYGQNITLVSGPWEVGYPCDVIWVARDGGPTGKILGSLYQRKAITPSFSGLVPPGSCTA